MGKELGLYIHIPFCKTLCHYCDFCKFINQKEETISKYIDFLVKEIEEYSSKFNDITSIYIGGGTPNSIDLKHLKRLFKALEDINPIEYTIETNIEFIDQKFINLLKKTKVNRISIGIQSFNDNLIKTMNRFHNKVMCINGINLLKYNGYNNINIDMIYGVKDQTIEQLESDLNILESIDVKHVSYYSLILEEKSVFGKKYAELDSLIDEDLEAIMNEKVITYLKNIGYTHYEISNFSKENFESYHNKLYWKRSEYIGCGASATGYLNICQARSLNKNKFKIMKELLSKIDASDGNVVIVASGGDLLKFSQDLMLRAKSEESIKAAAAKAERHLTKEEVMNMLGVCDTTLWSWNKKGYLKSIKIGNKVRYSSSEVAKLMKVGDEQ